MTAPHNFLVAASAGTGKTFALTSHILRILLSGENPDAVLALTFSRLAAAEIFDRTVSRLADAAESEKGAAKLSSQLLEGTEGRALQAIFPSGIEKRRFLEVLRDMLRSQHRSRLGTIDSFMAKTIQMFSQEAGMRSEMKMLDDDAAAIRQERIVEELLQSRHTDVFTQLRTILEYSEGGRALKAFRKPLLAKLRSWHERLLDQPSESAWGYAHTIWENAPQTAELVSRSPEELISEIPVALDAFRTAAASCIAEDAVTQREYFETFCAAIENSGSYALDLKIAAVDNFIKAAEACKSEVKCKRERLQLSKDAASALHALYEVLLAKILNDQCKKLRGIHVLMFMLESRWAQTVRSEGELVFSDIPRLLALLPIRERRLLEWRMDGSFRHLALDEFQDTSPAQWRALRMLADELKQADDGRSLFVVGDIKQAIYGWRGGDSRLFAEERDSGIYETSSLAKSHRFRPEIAEFVNRAMNADALSRSFSKLISPSVSQSIAAWGESWETHGSAVEKSGYVCISREINPEKSPADTTTEIMLAAEIIAQRIERINPFERGLTSAVLVRKSDEGQALARELRERHGIRATWEGDSALSGSPEAKAVLDAISLAQHPNVRSLAWGHLKTTVLGKALLAKMDCVFADEGLERISGEIARMISRKGLPATVAELAQISLAELKDKDVSEVRAHLDSLVAAASDYICEEGRAGTALDFVRFVQSKKKRTFADPSTVKILTIHRSKGLGFDIVFVPLFCGARHISFGSLTNAQNLILTGHGNPVSWYFPNAKHTDLDSVINAAKQEIMAQNTLGELCVSYVAFTRAKAELQVIIPPNINLDKPAFHDHIVRTFSPESEPLQNEENAEKPSKIWEYGDEAWFEKEEAKSAKVPESSRRWATPEASVMPPPKRRTPSTESNAGKPFSRLFELHSGESATERGTRLHAAFAKIGWLKPGDTAQPENVSPSDLDLTIASPLKTALTEPPEALELWREKSFEQVSNGEWISGIFDRVSFWKENGTIFAEIQDWKTNRRAPGESSAAFAERMTGTYSGQMRAYRKALSKLTSIPEARIKTTLLLAETLQTVSTR